MPTERHDELLYALVGKRIKEKRGRVSQEKLGALVNLSRTSITNLEKGRQRVPLHQLMRIADALDCELTALLPSMAELRQSDGDVTLDIDVVGTLTPNLRAVLGRYTMKEKPNG